MHILHTHELGDAWHTLSHQSRQQTNIDWHTHTWDRLRHTHSFRLTKTHQPPLLPVNCLRLPYSVHDAFRLMHSHPHRLPLHPFTSQPPIIKSQQPMVLSQNETQNTSVKEPLMGVLLLPLQSTENTMKLNPIRCGWAGENVQIHISFFPPSSSSCCVCPLSSFGFVMLS